MRIGEIMRIKVQTVFPPFIPPAPRPSRDFIHRYIDYHARTPARGKRIVLRPQQPQPGDTANPVSPATHLIPQHEFLLNQTSPGMIEENVMRHTGRSPLLSRKSMVRSVEDIVVHRIR